HCTQSRAQIHQRRLPGDALEIECNAHAAYRVRIALNLKGIPWQTALVDLRSPANAQHTPEFRALNPQGLIPVVADGDTTITQSLAIIEYLEENHPQPPLLPGSAADRAQVRSLAL